MSAINGNGHKVSIDALAKLALILLVGWMAVSIQSNGTTLGNIRVVVGVIKESLAGEKLRHDDHVEYDKNEHQAFNARLREIESD